MEDQKKKEQKVHHGKEAGPARSKEIQPEVQNCQMEIRISIKIYNNEMQRTSCCNFGFTYFSFRINSPP